MRGGYGSSRHGSLAQRSQTGNQTGNQTGSTPRAATPARHCSVDGQPSLLVEWRHLATGWEGRVISVVWLDAVGWATVERWLPASEIVATG